MSRPWTDDHRELHPHRATGANPRALKTNPRARGANPRALEDRQHKVAWLHSYGVGSMTPTVQRVELLDMLERVADRLDGQTVAANRRQIAALRRQLRHV